MCIKNRDGLSLFIFDTFWSLADTGRFCLPRVSKFLQISKQFPWERKPTNSRSYPNHLVYWVLPGLSPLGHCSPILIAPGLGTWQLEMAPTPQSLLKLFKLDNPKPTYPASPIPSCENRNKGSCPHFPLDSSAPWSTLVLPLVALCGVTCPRLLGTLNNELSFQWQSPPPVLASLYLNNNETYILKQVLKLTMTEMMVGETLCRYKGTVGLQVVTDSSSSIN